MLIGRDTGKGLWRESCYGKRILSFKRSSKIAHIKDVVESYESSMD